MLRASWWTSSEGVVGLKPEWDDSRLLDRHSEDTGWPGAYITG